MSPRYAGPRRLRTTLLGTLATSALVVGLTGCGSGGSDGSSADSSADSSAGGATGGATGGAASSSPSPSPSATFPTPKVVDGSITATDRSFALKVPSGWTSAERGVPAPFVVAVQDQTEPTDQIVVSAFSGAADAAATARRTATGLAAQKITCDTATIDGRSLVDCHYVYQGKPVRKMFFPFVHEKKSALLLYQTQAASRAAGYAELEPILATWRWSDGSRLVKG